MNLLSFIPRISHNNPEILRGIHAEQVTERSRAVPRTDQWAENYVPSRQPAAVSETGGLRGSKASWRGGR